MSRAQKLAQLAALYREIAALRLQAAKDTQKKEQRHARSH